MGADQVRRAALFRETPLETCQRVVLGAIWSLKPKRFHALLPLARVWIAELFEPSAALPDPRTNPSADELMGIAHELSVPTLLEAYRRGLFPHSHFGPQKWLSPPQRCVLFFDELHLSKRLRRLMRQGKYAVTFDRDFEGVMKACAGKREGRWHLTWITPAIMRAYADLFDAGHAHSFEVWNSDGELVGGGYGVSVGGVFVTESQFSREPNTSKLGFAVFNWHLAKWGYALNDGKWATPTILDMGFRAIPREAYLRRLVAAESGDEQGRWQVEAQPELVAGWQPGAAAGAGALATPCVAA